MLKALETKEPSRIEEPVQFESRLKISHSRVRRLARKVIGAYQLVPEPARDVQVALKSIGVAEEIIFNRLEEDMIYLSPQPGVSVPEFNTVLMKVDRALGDRSLFVKGFGIALLVMLTAIVTYWAKITYWP